MARDKLSGAHLVLHGGDSQSGGSLLVHNGTQASLALRQAGGGEEIGW
jgi:hypothetical protein